VYVYRRRDGSSFELEQRITVDALVRCPTTGQSVERVMQPFSPRYKGTGFTRRIIERSRQSPVELIQAAPAEPSSGRRPAIDDQRQRPRADPR
jgi:predicted nucleic acid-binding Zn ribbon protein